MDQDQNKLDVVRPSPSNFPGDLNLEILKGINDEYKRKIEELSINGLDDDNKIHIIEKLQSHNRILHDWVNGLNDAMVVMVDSLNETEIALQDKYCQMSVRLSDNLQKFPNLTSNERDLQMNGKQCREVHKMDGSEHSSTDNVDGHSRVIKQLEDMTEKYEAVLKEKESLSQVIDKIREGDAILHTKTCRLEAENNELNEMISELKEKASVSDLQPIQSDVSAMDSVSTETIVNESDLPLPVFSFRKLSEQSTELLSALEELKIKDEAIRSNWKAFLIKTEKLLQKNDLRFELDDEHSMTEFYCLLKSYLAGDIRKEECKELNIQVEYEQQLLTNTLQELVDTENSMILLLEKSKSSNCPELSKKDITTIMSDLKSFIVEAQEAAKTKIETTIDPKGIYHVTGYIDIPEIKFQEILNKIKQEKDKAKRWRSSGKDRTECIESWRSNITSLLLQIESLRDLVRSKLVLNSENTNLQKSNDTMTKQIATATKIIENTFNGIVANELISEHKKKQLRDSFKVSQQIGMTIAVQSLFAEMANKIGSMEGAKERTHDRIQTMMGTIFEKEYEKSEIMQEKHDLEKKIESMQKDINMVKMTQEELSQIKKFIHSAKLEMVHLLGNPTALDGDVDKLSLSSLINDLKREIDTKEEVLKNRKQMIDNLELCLNETRKRAMQLESENQKLIRSANELSKKMTSTETEKDDLQQRQKELDKQIAENEARLTELTKEKEQLDFEIKHSKDLNDILNFNLKTLSEQLSELFGENMAKDRQIQILRDSNLELRDRITELNKDIIDYKELLELKNLSSQFQLPYQKECETNTIKHQTNSLNEEICKLRELFTAIVQETKKQSGCGKYNMDDHEVDSNNWSKSHTRNAEHKKSEMDTASNQIKEILSMSQEMAQAHFDSQRYEELKIEAETLQAGLKEFSERNDHLCAMLSQYETRYKEFETEIGKLSHENSNLLHQIDNLTHDLREQSQKNAKLIETNVKLGSELHIFQKNCKCLGSTSPDKKVRLASQISQLRNEVRDLTQENGKLKETLKKNHNEAQKSIKQARTDKERYQSECNQLVEVMADLKTRIATLQMNLSQKDSELVNALEIKKLAVLKREEIEKSTNEMDKRYKDLLMNNKSLKNQLEELRMDYTQASNEHRKREERTLEELQIARQAIQEQQIRIAQQEVNFQRLLDVKKKLEKKAEGYLKEIKKLESKLSGETGTKNALMDLTDMLEAEQKSLKEKICRLTNADQDLNKAMSALESLKHHNHDLTNKYEELQKQYNSLHESHEHLLNLRIQSLKALETSKNIFEEGEVKHLWYKEKIEELLIIINILLKDRDYVKSVLNQKHRDITILSSQLSSLSISSQNPIEYPTLMHKPFYPSQLDELPAEYSASNLPEEIDIELKLKQLTSSLIHLQEEWNQGIENAVADSLS